MVNLKTIKRDIKISHNMLKEEYYENYSGLKDHINTSDIFERFEHLASKKMISYLVSIKKNISLDEQKKIKYLQAKIIDNYLNFNVSNLTDEITIIGAKSDIIIGKKRVPFRYINTFISNENVKSTRSALEKSTFPIILDMNILLKQRMEKLFTLSAELGYNNYRDLYSKIKDINFNDLRIILERFLDETSQLFKNGLSAAAENMGLSLDELERADILYLFRGKEFDSYFEKVKSIPILRKTLMCMGIDLTSQSNIILDTEERPKKSSRAFVFNIEVPNRIILMTMPKGGQGDYRSLFHEIGHAEHWGNVRSNLEIEYKYLGDNSVSETYAFLLEYLLSDRIWLDRYIKIEDKNSYIQFIYLHKLYLIRRYIAKFLYELELHKGKVSGMDRIYSTILNKTLYFHYPKEHYLLDVDDGFYCADYLRAWIFEVQLRTVLKETFGEVWFDDKRTGEYLKGLWRNGTKYNIDELVEMIGCNRLDIKPLTQEFADNLKPY
jgi:hypothetical protein